ncbi:SWIM zinc finger family protein [Bacillus sp. SM2101]|uniref:SWIM zinc finger family protein n=1 Tax=Bacillus sp. SM2101 TaxID=2805366 RepID=UPI001BDE1D48|nr:SWIM zinc finger family protein [Bacillus sp. SM2101]
MLQDVLSKEQVVNCAEKIKELLAPDNEKDRILANKGLLLYRQGNVYNVNVEEDVVRARVQDVTPFDVSLDLDFIQFSECTCTAEHFCRHQLAVFFSVYAAVDRVGNFLEEWKRSRTKIVENIALSTLGTKKVIAKYEEKSIASWMDFFEKEYTSFLQQRSHDDNYFFASLYHRYYANLKGEAPTQLELKRLFTMHAGLTTMAKMNEHLTDISMSSYGMDNYVTPYIHHLVDDIIEQAELLGNVTLPFIFDSLLQESIERLHTLFIPINQFKYDRMTVYRVIWSKLLQKKQWVDLERAWLQTRLDERENEDKKADLYVIALAHMAFLDKNDEDAISLYSQLDDPTALPYSFTWLIQLADKKAWARMDPWVYDMLTKLDEYISSSHSYDQSRTMTRKILHLLADYSSESNKDDVYVEAMEKLLPYSYYEFDDYLYTHEQYKKWVDLQILVGFAVDEHDRYTLKEIEEKDREVLLPYYHYSIMKMVKLKNRQSYKQAIKFLKKLRAHYRKLKRENDWNIYINKLATSHKRLRAFQEELRKGKLLHE